MVKDRASNPLDPARQGPNWTAAVVMVANTLQFTAIGLLGLVVNMGVYVAANGSIPEYDGESQSLSAAWVGNLPLTLPWWYFAATALVYLGVAIYAIPVSRRYMSTQQKFGAWRTTPKFLCAIAVFAALFQWIVAGYYDSGPSFTSLYMIGPCICLATAALAFTVSRVLPHPTTDEILAKAGKR